MGRSGFVTVFTRSIFLILIAGLGCHAAAVDLTWDATPGGASNDGAGTWLSAGQWNNGSPSATWSNANPDNAIFGVGGTGGTITLGSVTAGTVTVNAFSGTYSFSSGSLLLQRGWTTNNGAGTIVFNSPLTLGAPQTWINNAASNLSIAGTFSRNAGSSVNFTGSGFFDGAGLLAGITNTAQGWATITGSDWAISDGSKAVALGTYYTTTTGGNTAANYTGKDVDVTSAPSLDGAITINTLRYNTNAARTVTLSGVNTVSTGGILVTNTTGTNTSTLTGGTSITSGNGSDLIVHQHNANAVSISGTTFTANGKLALTSKITGSIGLTKAGSGILDLQPTTSNDYSGGTTIGAGDLIIRGSSSGGVPPTSGPLGTGTVTLTGTGRLFFYGPSNPSPNDQGNALNLSGDVTIDNFAAGASVNNGIWSGAVSFGPQLQSLTLNTSGNGNNTSYAITGPISLNNDFTLLGSSAGNGAFSLTPGGTGFTWSADRTLTVNRTASTIFRGALNGGANRLTFAGTSTALTFGDATAGITGTSGGIVVNGPTVAMNGANSSFSGGVSVQSGTLATWTSSTPSALGSGPITSGPFGTGALTLTSGANFTYGNPTVGIDMSLAYPISITGPGTITLTATDSQSSHIHSLNGTITFSGSPTVVLARGGVTNTWDQVGGSLIFNSDVAFTCNHPRIMGAAGYNTTWTAPTTLTLNGSSIIHFVGTLNGSGGALTLAGSPTSGNINGVSGATTHGLVVDSSTGGVFNFTGASTYTGGTTNGIQLRYKHLFHKYLRG